MIMIDGKDHDDKVVGVLQMILNSRIFKIFVMSHLHF